jgi:hypothetical protein
MQNASHAEKWAQMKLRSSVPGYTTGFTSLKMKERLLYSHNKCFCYATRLVWGYLGKKCHRERYRCVVIGVRCMHPNPDGDYMGHRVAQVSIIIYHLVRS